MTDGEGPRETDERRSPDPIRVVISTHRERHASSGSLIAKFLKSDLAKFTVAIAEFVAALGCLGILIGGAYATLGGIARNDPATIVLSLIGTPVAFVLQLANFIVLAKVAELLRR